MSRLKILVVDDSSVIRSLLTQILSSDPEIEVVGTAPDPYIARDKLVALKPDLMTLDIEMPKMDGITFLEKVMEFFPTRVVIISSLSQKGSALALRALELGAIDVIEKPSMDVARSIESARQEWLTRIKSAARAKLLARSSLPQPKPVARKSTALSRTTHQVVAIASSTGGTEALKAVIPQLPSDFPGIVIVQHMPPVFTRTYAEHLQKLCSCEVKEAEQGDKVLPGRVIIAPGNYHMEIERSGGYYLVKLHQGPLLHGVRPAADILMKSVAEHAGANSVGVVLTGMGKDGAQGLLEMKNAGSYNIAQDEESCVVYGMPKMAVQSGGIDRTVPLKDIASHLVEIMNARKVA